MLTKEQLIDAYEQGLSINTRNGNLKIVTILGDVYGINHCDTNSKLVKFWMFENFERNQATIEQPKPKIDLSILKEGEIYYLKALSGDILFKHLSVKVGFFDCILSKYQYFVNFDKAFNMSKETNKRLCDIDFITELRLPTESELELFYSKFPELKPKKYNGRAVKCDTVEQHKIVSKIIGVTDIYCETNFNNHYIYIDNQGTYLRKHHTEERNHEIISFADFINEHITELQKLI